MKNNIPAFPRTNTTHWDAAYESSVGDDGAEGMTLRDYFAAKVLKEFTFPTPKEVKK